MPMTSPQLILPFISCWFQTCTTFPWLEVQITEQRLATMSVSLCTQTRLHNLTIQVPNTRVWFPDLLYIYASFTSLHYDSEHGLLLNLIFTTFLFKVQIRIDKTSHTIPDAIFTQKLLLHVLQIFFLCCIKFNHCNVTNWLKRIIIICVISVSSGS